MLTLLSTTNSIFLSSSVTVTPAFGSKLSPTFKVWFLTPSITGALLPFTVKFIDSSVFLPRLSVALYVITYVVSCSVSKLSSLSDETLTFTVFPLTSTALTLSIKLNAWPAFIVTFSSFCPFLVIVGPTVDALTFNCTFKVFDSPPKSSFAVIYKSYIPSSVPLNDVIFLSLASLTSKVILSLSASSISKPFSFKASSVNWIVSPSVISM